MNHKPITARASRAFCHPSLRAGCFLLILLSALTARGEAQLQGQWIWTSPTATENERAWFRKEFTIDEALLKQVKTARLYVTCDNHAVVFLNGKQLIRNDEWQTPNRANVAKVLRSGKNVIAVEASNDSGPAGLFVSLQIQRVEGKAINIGTDKTWQSTNHKPGGWPKGTFNDKDFKPATEIAKLGGGAWGDVFGNGGATNVAMQVPEGFILERIYTVQKFEQGSWVALTVDAKGRLIASDQGDKGLWRITPSKPGDGEDGTLVEAIDVPISNAQGMVWAFDALYVNRNGPGSGLWRITDTNGDDRLDKAEQVMPLSGGGEHGQHGVIVTEDGKGLYVVGGNGTQLPGDLTATRVPPSRNEDLLSSRRWNAGGPAQGNLTSGGGGWICRVSPDGKQRELICHGFRNQYDIALNRYGDLFSYDADMEWDMGMPWYRPTRVCLAASGSEFGWRNGSGKWPAYYADSVPPIVDIGPGSPVGVVFGYGTKFPSRWQEALYILDWTYGTIWAIHMQPNGGGYSAKVEEFVSGTPLPVTDAIVGKDGAFYFAVGGRGTQSAVYRVTYVGKDQEKSKPFALKSAPAGIATRRELETLHRPGATDAVTRAWKYLGNDDRWLRYAARIAVEHQPVDEWRSKALAEQNPQSLVTAVIALARHGKSDDLESVLQTLDRINLSTLKGQSLLEAFRAYQLAFIRLGHPSNTWRKHLVAIFDPLFPSKDDAANRELVQLLVYLDAPSVVEKTVGLIESDGPAALPTWSSVLERNRGYGGTVQRMLDNMPPVEKLHQAFALRNVRYGWTMPQREAFFRFINAAAKHPGGNQYAGYLKQIRDDALKNCSPAERHVLASITGESLNPLPPFVPNPPKGPGKKWTIEEAAAAFANSKQKRSYENGRNLYHAVGCVKCHRFNGEGGAIGPDLSTVANKFSHKDLLDSIINPSKTISDQYASSIVTKTNGDVVTGLVVKSAEKDVDNIINVYPTSLDVVPIKVSRSDIKSVKRSSLSQMPEGLINSLNDNELADLLAYLLSRGDAQSPLFKK